MAECAHPVECKSAYNADGENIEDCDWCNDIAVLKETANTAVYEINALLRFIERMWPNIVEVRKYLIYGATSPIINTTTLTAEVRLSNTVVATASSTALASLIARALTNAAPKRVEGEKNEATQEQPSQ